MFRTSSFLHQFHYNFDSSALLPHGSCLSSDITRSRSCRLHIYIGGWRSCNLQLRTRCSQVQDPSKTCYLQEEEIFNHDESHHTVESDLQLHLQTLRNFPIEKLYGEVVMVRLDSTLLLESLDSGCSQLNRALSTIRYIYYAGAKVLLVSNWGRSTDSMLLSSESFSDHLSSLLKIEVVPANSISGFMHFKTKEVEDGKILLLDNLTNFKEEVANCLEFSEKLSSGATIFVNDAFSLSHKILASTVGVTRFCHASIAGFHFENELFQLMKITEAIKQPYIAIIGGNNFLKKATALHLLASNCDGLFFVGQLAFQVIHALGFSLPGCYVERNAVQEVLKLVQVARHRKIPLCFPTDFCCVNDSEPKLLETFPFDGIPAGWIPIDLGPLSLKKISSLLSMSKKVLWIGSVRFDTSKDDTVKASELATMLERISRHGCDVTVVGNAACKAIAGRLNSFSHCKLFKNASVIWEYLKGRTLPGFAALDKAFPHYLDWGTIYADPTRPLIVDIGSGNGLFILKMAKRWENRNFLGLEINKKLVKCCMDNILESDIKNKHFISTNATSTFRSIVSSYPGDVVLVTIQCPNPDFDREEHRWRMVQRTLVEAIIDLLMTNGKVFLQSDIEVVTRRMKEQFITYGKDKVLVDGDDIGWIEENPFGVRSDWEQHVIDRGSPMFRIMLRKVQ